MDHFPMDSPNMVVLHFPFPDLHIWAKSALIFSPILPLVEASLAGEFHGRGKVRISIWVDP